MSTEDIIKTNLERIADRTKKYDPISGEGSDTCERKPFKCKGITKGKTYMIPSRCFNEDIIHNLSVCGSVGKYLFRLGLELSDENKELVRASYHLARIKYDFEYWCATDVVISDLMTGADINFVLNRAQRGLLKEFYIDWYANRPCKYIITKNRQNGFSTLTEMLFGWIQIVLRPNTNSIICAHIENTSRIIRGMYTKMIRNYPKNHTLSGLGLSTSPYEGSSKTRIINETGSRMSVGSAEKPDALVGDKITLFHASEVGLYQTTKGKTPKQLVQSIQSGIQEQAGTVIVYESTARGVGNFFFEEWLRAVRGESGFTPWFVPWFENMAYEMPIDNYEDFVATLTNEEIILFRKGATLEGLKWRRNKLKDYSDRWRFMQDFPATADEAFMSTGRRFYPIEDTMRLREGVIKPNFIGDLYGKELGGKESIINLEFKEESNGNFKIWFKPEHEKYTDRYVVVVDIGGLSENSDRSVICVIDRKDMAKGGVPIVVAEWCGHIDHDLLAWKAVQISTWYQEALLIIESNTLESERTEGDHFEFILDEIADAYNNLFCRTSPEKIRAGLPAKWGFHTNRSTKQMVCNHNKKVLRENMYIETCEECCDEYDQFEVKENGSLGAIEGAHDDRHITRAIGIWACYQYLNPPRLRTKTTGVYKKKTNVINESSI